MLQCGTSVLVWHVLTCDFVRMCRHAVLAICSLCSHKRSQQKIIGDNVVSHLLRLAKSDDAVIHACAIRAICVLCANKSTRLRLVKEGVVPVIVDQAQAGACLLIMPVCLLCLLCRGDTFAPCLRMCVSMVEWPLRLCL